MLNLKKVSPYYGKDLDFANYYGVDLAGMYNQWLQEVYRPQLVAKYGDRPFAFIVLHPDCNDWRYIIDYPPVAVLTSDDEDPRVCGPEGYAENVLRKLRIVLREECPSSDAREPHQGYLRRPGDFGYAGAEKRKGFPAGFSGYLQESDVEALRGGVDPLIEAMNRLDAMAEVIRGDKENRMPGQKYGNNILLDVSYEKLFLVA